MRVFIRSCVGSYRAQRYASDALGKRSPSIRMKALILYVSVVLIGLGYFVCLSSAASSRMETHKEWIAKSLTEIESVKVGMTRAELSSVFTTEGGISTRMQQRFVYRECPYIKVEVEFEAVGQPEEQIVGRSEDKIKKISKPFLEWSISD